MATVAIDYDDTIVHANYPHAGIIKTGAKEVINQLYEEGHRIIINTYRSGEAVETAKNYLVECGVKFDAINENLPWLIAKYGTDCRKISADIYIDDKNLGGITDCWSSIYDLVHDHLKRFSTK